VVAVRAHDHQGTLGDRRLALCVPTNADDAAVLDHDVGDGEALPDLGARL
jgi:hypothetical protein